MASIQDLLIDQMADLYDAEKQLVKALPKMAKAASNDQLKDAIESHLEQTRGQVERLERAFAMLGARAKGKPCAAMKGLVEEGRQTIEEDLPEPLMDSAIIAAAQKVEHYEIAGYGTVTAWAQSLGLDDVAGLLSETLNEEKGADERLTEVNEAILEDVEGVASREDEEDEAAEGQEEPDTPGVRRGPGQVRNMKK
jgi:ferritin-like metal-binding protein YciE